MSSPRPVEVERLSRRFGAFVADDEVSFSVAPGETYGMLGPNGAGKTTLIRMLTTLLPPSSGRARIEGRDVVREKSAVRRAIGTVSQAQTTDENLTVRENLAVQGKMYGLFGRTLRERIEHRLRQVGLWERRGQVVRHLSGGMRRRLEIARGVLHRPRVLFLDEPTTGLDPQSRRAIWDMFGELKSHDPDLAIILTTHAMEEADVLCSRVAILDRGRILCEDSPAALKRGLATGERVELETDRAIAEEDRKGIADEGATDVRFASPTRVAFTARPGEATGRRVARLLEIEGYHIVHLTIALATLEDVFFSYTGRALREARARAMSRRERPARGPLLALLGISAIGQRAFLTLWRQPVLVVSTMIFPVVYLLVLGNAMNRQLEFVPLAVVDEAGNAYSAECRRGVLALESGRRLVAASFLSDRAAALDGLRRGRYRGIWVLPFGLSPQGPAPSFIGDNTDRFSVDTLESALRQIWQEVTAPKDVRAGRARGPARGLPVPRLPDVSRAGRRVPGDLHGLDGLRRPAGARGPDVRVPRGVSRHADHDRDPRRRARPRGRPRRIDRRRTRPRGDPRDHAALGRRRLERGGRGGERSSSPRRRSPRSGSCSSRGPAARACCAGCSASSTCCSSSRRARSTRWSRIRRGSRSSPRSTR